MGRQRSRRAAEHAQVAGETVPRCRECGAIGVKATITSDIVAERLLYDHEESCGVRMAQDRMAKRQPPPNPYVRAEQNQGVPIVSMIRGDLTEAWRSYDKEVARNGEGTDKSIAIKGRIRGLAQALATLQSPYTRQQADQGEEGGLAKWNRYVVRVMNEYRA